jgi:microcystin-dependent protein
MSNLPANADMTGASVTQGQFRARLNDVLDYLRGMLGSTGTPGAGRAALGLGTLATLNEVGAAQLGAGAVTTAKLADAAVTAAKIADAAATAAKIADAAVTTAKLADGAVTAAKLAAGVMPDGVPAGTVVAFAGSAAPSGWLVCNGAAISRTTYAALFAAIGTAHGAGDGATTFNLPDLRGEFIRGLDGGRGVDSGRVLGSAQAGEVQSHGHALRSGSGNIAFMNETTPVMGATSSGGGLGGWTTGQIAATGGSETRPRNVALLYIIKA